MGNKYNGWENRETWACQMWLNNDEPIYRTKEALRKSAKGWIEYSDTLKDFVLNLHGELENNPPLKIIRMFSDIGSLHRVNFDEIAQSEFSKN